MGAYRPRRDGRLSWPGLVLNVCIGGSSKALTKSSSVGKKAIEVKHISTRELEKKSNQHLNVQVSFRFGWIAVSCRRTIFWCRWHGVKNLQSVQCTEHISGSFWLIRCMTFWHRHYLFGVVWRKAKVYNTYIALQAAYGSCSGAFVSQTERVYSL